MAGKETVLVTGAGGCVGSKLVQELVAAGYRVKATDIPGRPFGFGGSRIKEVRGDLSDPEFVDGLPMGTDFVIHAGASVDISKPWDYLKTVNLDATTRLWERCVEAGIERFVFFSSASIYAGQDRPIREEDPQDPAGPYEKSKFLAEKVLLRGKLGGAATRLVILRPALIIGPFGTALMATIATLPPLLKSYLGFAPKAVGGPLTNVVHSLDVARAAVHLLEHGRDGEAYNVANDDILPFSQFFNVACEESGVPQLPIPAFPFPPKKLVATVAPAVARPEVFWALNKAAGGLWSRIAARQSLSGPLAPHFDPGAISYAARDAAFDATKLKETGFECRFPDYRSAIRDVISWYRENHWLPA
jgi:nucleoside-diphosphate-sugar epimerase